MSEMSLIKLISVGKTFGLTRALSGVSLNIEAQESVCFMGANGAGKSTLLSCIAGVLRPEEGEIIRAREITLGYLGDDSFLYSQLTIEENWRLVADVWGMINPLAAVKSTAELLGLVDYLSFKPRECSQGILRRAAIGRAIIHKPTCLLLDEPFSNLDTNGREQLVLVLNEHKNNGGTLLLATHDKNVVREHSNRAFYLERGRIVERGD